jgi:hypothetical protein
MIDIELIYGRTEAPQVSLIVSELSKATPVPAKRVSRGQEVKQKPVRVAARKPKVRN